MPESLHGLRLSRFYNYEGVQYLPAPTGGWNPDANPWELPENQAPILDNFLVSPGKITMRGPFAVLTTLSSPFNPIGYVIGDRPAGGNPSGWCSLGRKLGDAVKIVDPWKAPLAGASAASLASGVTTLTQVDISAGSTGTVALTADTVPGPRWINFDGLLYGISYDAVAAAVHDTNSNYFIKPLNLLTLPYTQAAATVPTILANAPHGAFDLKGYLSRIWLLGGVDTPGALTVHEPTTIYYTNPGTSGVGTASADWKDPVSGLVNKIRMDNNNADFGVGLAQVPNALIIFRHDSVWILRGTTSSTFQIQVVSKEIGCIDARSIVETDHGVYFMSHRGLMLTDGTSVVNVSGTVEQQLQQILSIQQGDRNSGWITCVRTSQGQIMVSIGTGQTGASPTLGPIWTGLFDTAMSAWTRMTSTLWMADNSFSELTPPLLIARPERRQVFSVGNSQFTMLEDYTSSLTVGKSFLVNASNSWGLYDENGANWFPIPAKWQSRFCSVIGTSTRRLAQAKRYIVDYNFGGNPAPASGWHVGPVDASDVSLDTAIDVSTVTTTSVFSGAEPQTLPRIQRQNQDFTKEIADAAFTVSWSLANTTGTPSWRADIYGIAIELQRTRDSR